MPDTVSLNDLTRRPITNEDGTHMLSYELHGYPLGTAMIINQVSQDTSDLYVASGNSLSDVLQTKPFHEIKNLACCMHACCNHFDYSSRCLFNSLQKDE